ncbi:hypothetical protein TRL7639_01179 [Falsiruegeria litorea R37]|uniref:DUF3108 domain-containing protein n=1 Tax=Falsiruegeria litorea R37 TaxID=1200284 RepID=A0A1Y5S3M6_9RHOB|nr:DUF3108 domain-containing protein [Falsiruegeria litorea]SLN29300.1 hypothetical protein TRL7639_01179 [Falsiruegeria litorea R37]
MYLRRIALALMVLPLFSALPARAADTDALFDVQAWGVKIGEFRVTGQDRAGFYDVKARFETTGVVKQLGRIWFTMSATGRKQGREFTPIRYSEQVRTGRRQSSAQMDYSSGFPLLTGGKLGTEDAEVLDATAQTDTVDPLTAMFVALRDQPRAQLCKLNQPIFDGARRTIAYMTGRKAEGEKVICTGQFRRLGGYSAKQLRQGRNSSFELTYVPAGAVMRVQEARVTSSRGTAVLTRR